MSETPFPPSSSASAGQPPSPLELLWGLLRGRWGVAGLVAAGAIGGLSVGVTSDAITISWHPGETPPGEAEAHAPVPAECQLTAGEVAQLQAQNDALVRSLVIAGQQLGACMVGASVELPASGARIQQ